jgi:glycosyltransferase involved in cell wall biosynthesis
MTIIGEPAMIEQYSHSKVIVGIPAFNEQDRIAEVVRGALQHAATVVVVDDGSRDLTARNALNAGATVIRHEHNAGKGAAVASLFRYAAEHGADALVLIDGDGQHNPDEIPEVVSPVLAGQADVVVGSRFLTRHSEIPRHRVLGQRAFNVMTALASGVPCSDSQSGFRAFGHRAFSLMRIAEATFSVECEQQFECALHGLQLIEVPISCRYDLPTKRSAYVQGVDVLSRLCVMSIRRRVLRQVPIHVPHQGGFPTPVHGEFRASVALGAD